MAYDIKGYTGRSPEYVARRKALAEKWIEQLKSKGLHAYENFDGEIEVTFTSLGLSTVIATVGLDELEYHMDNEIEENE